MKASRVINWDGKLALWAYAQNGKPFSWGNTDCGTMIREAAQVMYGKNLWPEVPQYHTAQSAAFVLRKRGLPERHLRARGAMEIARGFWTDGDVVISREIADGDIAPAHMIVIRNKLLGVTLNGKVEMYSLHALTGDFIALRLPHVIG